MVTIETLKTIYSKVQKYVDSSSVNNAPTAAGEDCILASLERPSNYRLYYKGGSRMIPLSLGLTFVVIGRVALTTHRRPNSINLTKKLVF